MPRKSKKDVLPQEKAKAAAPKTKRARKASSKGTAAVLERFVELPCSDEVLRFDFPREGELLTSDSYTVRIYAETPLAVELSLDGSPWQACRESLGFWWYDWAGFLPGRHELKVRRLGEDGRWLESSVRAVTAGRP